MNFDNFLIPSVSNKKGDTAITIEDFKSLSPKKEVKKGDLIYKDGKFTLNKTFLTNRNEFTGFVGIIDKETNKAYLLKSTTEEAFANTLFVKGDKAVNTFSSDSLKFVIDNAGISVENLLFLDYKSTTNGYDVYEISNVENTSNTMTRQEDFSEDVKKEGEYDSNIVVSTQEQTEAYAQVGVEEVSYITYNYQEEPLEQLL